MALALVVLGCSTPAPLCEAGLVQLAITNGTESASYLALTDAQQNAVVAVTFPASGAPRQLCSGVLVTPSLVLSAGHCLNAVDRTQATVSLGTSVDAPLWSTSGHAVAHPTLDLMVVFMAEPVPSHLGVQLPGLAESDAIEGHLNRLVQVAGFGDDAARRSGVRLFLVEEVIDVAATEISVSADDLGGGCFGDSGGPLLARGPDGAVVVLGVLSHGAASCFGVDVYTRVDAARDWITFAGWRESGREPASTLERIGRCYGPVAVWSEENQSKAMSCEVTCGWSPQDQGYRCVEHDTDPCRGITDIGECVGHVATRCVEGEIHRVDCSPCGALCERSPRSGRPICVVED